MRLHTTAWMFALGMVLVGVWGAVLTFPLFVEVGIIVLLPVVAAFFSFIDYGSDLSARIEGDTSSQLFSYSRWFCSLAP